MPTITAEPGPVRSSNAPARWNRRLLAGLVVACGLLLLVSGARWRGIEAALSANAIAIVVGAGVVVSRAPGDVVVLSNGRSLVSALVITSGCSAGYLLGVLTLCTGPLVLVRRLSLVRVLGALGLAAGIVLTVNIARIATIALSVSTWGVATGLSLSHTFLGSILTLVGTAFAGLAFAGILLVPERAAHVRSRSGAG